MSWVECNKLLVPDDHPVQYPVLWFNTYSSPDLAYVCAKPVPMLAPNQWHTIDLSVWDVPKNAKAVLLYGFLIITSGKDSTVPDLALSFQRPGGPIKAPIDGYDNQAIAIGTTGGARTNASMVCPVTDAKIEAGWLRGQGWYADQARPGSWPDKPIPESWPDTAAYGVSFSLGAVLV